MMRDRRRGQGLLEFALVLPALLMLFFVIIEGGRLFHAYATVQHAAREGARYAVTGQNEAPMDRVTSIKHMAREAASGLVVDEDKVDLVNGFGSPYYDDSGALIVRVWGPAGENDAGGPGQRVTVRVVYNMPILTPFLKGIAPHAQLIGQIEMINEGFGATGDSHGGVLPPPLPAIPTEGPTATPSNTPTPTDTPTATPSPTPALRDLYLDVPLIEGDTEVTGGGEPGEDIVLRDLCAGRDLDAMTIPDGGFYQFNLSEGLIAGHTIAVIGYGQVDYAVVLEGTPTPTPTPTLTPTATTTPTMPFITLSPRCAITGTVDIVVRGYNWDYQNRNDDTHITWDGTEVAVVPADGQPSSWQETITVDVTAGSHTVEASTEHGVSSASATFTSPCPPTPTPTPIPEPDLLVDSVSVAGTAYVGYPVNFNAIISNEGTGPVNSLFWNDLFIQPNDPGNLPAEVGESSDVDWAGVSSLEPASSVGITLTYSSGFTQTGTYQFCVLADSLRQVGELDEGNNTTCGVVTVVTPTETPTPSPTPLTGPNPGSISGATWIWVGGNWTVPQSRVTVRCWQGTTLIATTYSQDGYYRMTDIPAGTGYRVTGEIQIDGVLYYDERIGVEVIAGEETPYVDLLLVPAF